MTTFTLQRANTLDSLNLIIEEYIHSRTGAKHIHFKPQSPHTQENVFSVTFKTVPQDDTGIAHILEHTVLCGSQKFPQGDPFFNMVRRSVSTFMNAMTGKEFTSYPFASQNKKDFNNLLEVYLDSTFFSLIRKESFLQEGWRYDFDEKNALTYKGVVLNEMKGAMDDPIQEHHQALLKNMFPGSTYQFNSGGDPVLIPELTYERLKEFYEVFYHPSNAIFMTYGDIPAVEHQARFEDLALQHFNAKNIPAELKRLSKAGVVFDQDSPYPPASGRVLHSVAAEEVPQEGESQVLLGWRIKTDRSLDDTLKLMVLDQAIRGGPSSPLGRILENSTLGHPSSLGGVDFSAGEAMYLLGLERVATDDIEKVFPLIQGALQKIKEEGVPVAKIEEILLTIKMHHCDIQGGMPYGLQMMFEAMLPVMAGRSAIEMLDLDSCLDRIRGEILAPDFVSKSVDRYFLNNQSKMEYVGVSDPLLKAKQAVEEKERLARQERGMTRMTRAKIKIQNKNLELSDREVEDTLPKLSVSDLDISETRISPVFSASSDRAYTGYKVPSNGVAYFESHFDLPDLSDRQIQLLPLYFRVFGDVGTKEMDYAQASDLFSLKQVNSPGFEFLLESERFNQKNAQEKARHIRVVFSFKTLNETADGALSFVGDYFNSISFHEQDRIEFLVTQFYQSMLSSLNKNGNRLAVDQAMHPHSFWGNLPRLASPRKNLSFLKEISEGLESRDPKFFQDFQQELTELHEAIRPHLTHFYFASNKPKEKWAHQARALFSGVPREFGQRRLSDREFHPMDGGGKTAFIGESSVNYCAISWNGPRSVEEDAGAMLVLSKVLSKSLHHLIREKGGAYGARCSFSDGAILINSYDDPRLLETLEDMHRVVGDFIKTPAVSSEEMSDAIIQSVRATTPVLSPIDSAVKEIRETLRNDPPGFSLDRQEQITRVTPEDLHRVAKKYLSEGYTTAVFTQEKNKEMLKKVGFEIQYVHPDKMETLAPVMGKSMKV